MTFLEGFPTNTLAIQPPPQPSLPTPPQLPSVQTTFDLLRLSDHLLSDIFHRQMSSTIKEESDHPAGVDSLTNTSSAVEDLDVWELKKRGREDIKVRLDFA